MENKLIMTVLGGGCKIGANAYLLKYGNSNILLDAGWNPSPKFEKIDVIPDFHKIDKLDAIFISHAHQDHIGSLFIISELFPDVQIYVSKETYAQYEYDDLIEIMMIDNLRIKRRKHENNELSDFEIFFFTEEVFNNLRSRMIPVEFYEKNRINKDIPISFILHPVSHIKGASAIELKFGKQNPINFVYTGDFTLDKQLLHRETDLSHIKNVDFLLIESTYGREKEFAIEKEREKLIQFIKKYINDKYILIPAFALGRTQEVMATICNAMEKGELPKDIRLHTKGLSGRVTNIYLDQNEESILDRCNINISNDAIYGEHLKPKNIIIVGNGMLMPDTPSYSVFRKIVKNKKGVIAFVGYLSPNSFGGKIWNFYNSGKYKFKIAGNQYDLSEVIMDKFRLSAHAQKKDIKKVIEQLNPGGIIITHGDFDAIKSVKKYLTEYNTDFVCRGSSIILEKKKGGMRVMKKTDKTKAHIVSVGTSMKWKPSVKDKFNIANRKETIDMLVKELTKKPTISAEVTGIMRGKKLNEGDVLFFISSDTEDGYICAKALEKYYTDNGYEASVVIIDELSVEKDFNKGIKNLVFKVLDIISNYSEDSIVYAIGGYKPQVYYMGMIGQIMERDVLYSYEYQDGILKLPKIPVAFDLRLFLENKGVIDTILTQQIDNIGQIPQVVQDLFEYNIKERRYELTPMGKILYDKFMKEYLTKGVIVDISIEQENIWKKSRKRIKDIDDIPDENVQQIINKLFLLLPNDIKKIKIEEQTNKEKSKETHLKYIGKTGGIKLKYSLHTQYGRFLCTIVLNKKNIQDKALRIIGKRMYL